MSERTTSEIRCGWYSQSDVAKEVFGGFEDLFAEDGRKVLLNYVVAFHGSGVEGCVCEFPVCTPFFATREKRHTLRYTNKHGPETRFEG